MEEEKKVTPEEVINNFHEEDLAPNIDDNRELTEEDLKETTIETEGE